MFLQQIFASHTTIRPAFVAEFIEREADAWTRGEAVSLKNAAWLGTSGMTVWEYLLLHTDPLADRYDVRESLRKTAHNPWPASSYFISSLAGADIHGIKVGRTFAEARELVQFQINCSRYVGERCRVYFDIPFWDVMALRAIARFRANYAQAMWAQLDRLHPA